MKAKYEIGQRLSFIARNKSTFNGNKISGIWKHYVGYVKQVRRSLLGVRYVINVAKSPEIFIVPQRDIIGVVEKKDCKQPKSNENGN